MDEETVLHFPYKAGQEPENIEYTLNSEAKANKNIENRRLSEKSSIFVFRGR